MDFLQVSYLWIGAERTNVGTANFLLFFLPPSLVVIFVVVVTVQLRTGIGKHVARVGLPLLSSHLLLSGQQRREGMLGAVDLGPNIVHATALEGWSSPQDVALDAHATKGEPPGIDAPRRMSPPPLDRVCIIIHTDACIGVFIIIVRNISLIIVAPLGNPRLSRQPAVPPRFRLHHVPQHVLHHALGHRFVDRVVVVAGEVTGQLATALEIRKDGRRA
mmetsp:Transcript_12113/g.34674  ORF Transcript_12113/g.34674 Transcript_12113/m.34674 type:complete len:218 (+) Transcript_12113:590-1243(+)